MIANLLPRDPSQTASERTTSTVGVARARWRAPDQRRPPPPELGPSGAEWRCSRQLNRERQRSAQQQPANTHPWMSTHQPRPRKVSKLSHQPSLDGPKATTMSKQSAVMTTPTKKRLGLSTSTTADRVKQLTLKPKPRTSLPTADNATLASTSIQTLARAIRCIQSRPPEPTPESLQALYGLCESAVGAGPSTSASLYERIRLEIERQTANVRRAIAQTELGNGGEEDWLRVWETEGRLFLRQLLLIRSVFLHLERTFVLESPALLSIWDLGLDLYRHSVIENEELSSRLTLAIVSTINKERDGNLIARPLLQSVISLLHTFSPLSHSSLFVVPAIAASHAYYKAEGDKLSVELDSSAYLRQIETRLAQEGERSELVLGVELKGSLLRVVLDELAAGHVEAIVDKDLPAMFDHDKKVDLTTVYSLLSRVASVTPLRTAFQDHLKDVGLEIVQDRAADDEMVNRLIALRAKALTIVNESFAADASFTQSVSQAFEFFINKRENKPAEQMAKFLDAKLRSGNRKMDDDQLETALQEVLFLFRFTQGKDIFEAFYKKDLAKRLLLNKSASFDAERSMLLKLKDECGPGFTQKLEIMFKDIELSQDVMKAYNSTAAKASDAFDLSVNVLSQGNWPSYPPTAVRLPDEMTLALNKFKDFYVAKHSGRGLKWQHSLDTCALKATFPKGGKKELAVSLFQAVCLLLFNDVPEGGKISFKDIVEATLLDPTEAKRTLQSLACGKVRVLTKHPKGRDVNESDEFSFNVDFKDDHVKIKINQIQQKETAQENKETTERVFTDRASHLQLAMVRIMKARKTALYSELVMETITQIGTRFKVEMTELKKQIESLIDREYIRRAEGKRNTLEYVA